MLGCEDILFGLYPVNVLDHFIDSQVQLKTEQVEDPL